MLKNSKYNVSRIYFTTNKFLFAFAIMLCILLPHVSYAQNFIPQPRKIEKGEGKFIINQNTTIVDKEYAFLSTYLNDHLSAFGLKLSVTSQMPASNYILLGTNEALPEEGYTINIAPERIEIKAKDRKGIFYALQTLFQMMPPEVYGGKTPKSAIMELSLPAIKIEDFPRYPYRGVMLDVSRTFFDKQTVMEYINWAARHKINKFHWHLTDDNGWRIEIKKYPDLTNKGAWRGPGEALAPSYGSGQKRYGGYYTQEDIREVVRYALMRNVEIIPEIELPGHSQAVTAAYPETFCLTPNSDNGVQMNDVWCAGRGENFDMIKDILTEVAGLFPSKYIHIGGDEVSFRHWRSCPRCQALMKEKGFKSMEDLQNYFVKRVETIVHDLGKETAVWNEAMKGGGLRRTTAIYAWETVGEAEKALKAGQPVVLMPASYFYIDMKHNPFDRGHTWANMVDTRRLYSFDQSLVNVSQAEARNIMGIEAAQFSELLDRPERFLEYQGYPKLCALAEVGWSAPKDKNWDDFYKRLTQSHLNRLAAMGIAFRMFPAEVTYDKGKITAKSDIPDAQIRYTLDFTEPTIHSLVYSGPLSDSNPEPYRFRTFYKTGYSTAVPPISKMEIKMTGGEKKVLNIPLKDYIDKEGLWLLSFTPYEESVTINRLEITGGQTRGETPYVIIKNGQRVNPFSTIRLYIDKKNIGDTLSITLTNSNSLDNNITLGLRPSPYVEPAVRISSSLTAASKFPFANIADYNFTSYSRTAGPCKKGDHLTYIFSERTECRSIEIRTGVPDVTRYIVTKGHIEYSYDGTTFLRGDSLNDNGCTTIYPEKPIKAVRISIEGSNGEQLVAFQDLRVIPKYFK